MTAPLPSDPPRPEVVLPLVEERLQVEQQVEETGALRIRVEVHETTETIAADTLAEQFSVRRTPVGRPVAARQAPHQDGDEWVVPVYEEVPVVEMRLVLKEEIRIVRRIRREPLEQQVRLRREQAVVERRQADGSWQPQPDPAGPPAPPAAAPPPP